MRAFSFCFLPGLSPPCWTTLVTLRHELRREKGAQRNGGGRRPATRAFSTAARHQCGHSFCFPFPEPHCAPLCANLCAPTCAPHMCPYMFPYVCLISKTSKL